jgi:hypothetical protein
MLASQLATTHMVRLLLRPELLRPDRLALMRREPVGAAAFGPSYADLNSPAEAAVPSPGLVPGADFDAYAAAALDGISSGPGSLLPEGLYDQHLLTEPAPGRYHCTTCPRMPAPSPPPITPPNPTPRPAGCWTTTCTPPYAT